MTSKVLTYCEKRMTIDGNEVLALIQQAHPEANIPETAQLRQTERAWPMGPFYSITWTVKS